VPTSGAVFDLAVLARVDASRLTIHSPVQSHDRYDMVVLNMAMGARAGEGETAVFAQRVKQLGIPLVTGPPLFVTTAEAEVGIVI
jgi:hypothetical protein